MRQNKINQRDALGCTELFEAVSNNDFQKSKRLLEAGADPNISENNGTTPLMEAGSGNDRQMVELLLAHRADPNLKDNFGDTAADYARTQGYEVLASFLDSAGNKI